MADFFQIAGHAFATRDQVLFALMNEEATDLRRFVEVTRFDVRPVAPTTATPGTLRLRGITAMSGGADIPTVKSDTSATSLPSQVTLKTFPDVTANSTDYASRQRLPGSVIGLTLPATGQRLPSARFVSYSNLASAQALTLREGQGVALVSGDTANYPHNASWYAVLSLRVGTALHSAFFSVTPPAPGSAAFGLFNAAGSGVVVEIVSLELTYVGQPTITTTVVDAPLVRFCRVGGVQGGESVTPVARVSSASLPGAITARQGRPWNPIEVSLISNDGIGAGELLYPELNQAAYRKIGTFRKALTHMQSVLAPGGTGPGVGSEFQSRVPQHGMDFRGSVAAQAIKLRPQEGFVAIVENAAAYSEFYYELEFSHTAPPSGGGGGGSANVAYPFIG